ncbi:MAG: helix-turn-helix transcriptional regulator [Phascolarctobacterium sp.]|nr:helix-turn-helix transcriptional regulator [Phascolarctobacterium sp.]
MSIKVTALDTKKRDNIVKDLIGRGDVVFSLEHKKIGLNVLNHRRMKGWTQEDLSAKSGVSRSRISDIERGRQTPKLDTIMMIAKALEIDYVELLKN